jgi:hypothetical protein
MRAVVEVGRVFVGMPVTELCDGVRRGWVWRCRQIRERVQEITQAINEAWEKIQGQTK